MLILLKSLQNHLLLKAEKVEYVKKEMYFFAMYTLVVPRISLQNIVVCVQWLYVSKYVHIIKNRF